MTANTPQGTTGGTQNPAPQGMPLPMAPLVDPKTGIPTQVGYRFLLSLWNRTSQIVAGLDGQKHQGTIAAGAAASMTSIGLNGILFDDDFPAGVAPLTETNDLQVLLAIGPDDAVKPFPPIPSELESWLIDSVVPEVRPPDLASLTQSAVLLSLALELSV